MHEAGRVEAVLWIEHVEVRIDRLLGAYSRSGERTVFIAYAGTATGGELRAGEETFEVDTFPPDQLPALAFPHDREILAAWREVGFRVIGHITFIKRYASTERFLRYQHENAYLLAKGNPQKPARTIPDVLEWQYTGNHLHPTQKPVSVLTPLVDSFSSPGDVVLDPFCGSGSTLLAARKLNRRFLGIELSKEYFDLAEQRLR